MIAPQKGKEDIKTMKKANIGILASILMMLLVAAAAGAATSAWFSDTKTGSAGPVETGTLTMSEPTVTYSSSAPTNWEPGESFVVKFHITNTGTLDIDYLGGNLVITNDDTDLAKVIEVTSIAEYIPNYGWQESIGGDQHYETLVGDEQSPLTLLELAQSYHSGEPAWAEGRKQDDYGGWVGYISDWITGDGYDIVPEGQPALPVGGTYKIHLTLKLMGPEAQNKHQGATLEFQITFTGCQGPDSYIDAIP